MLNIFLWLLQRVTRCSLNISRLNSFNEECHKYYSVNQGKVVDIEKKL